MSRSVSAPSSVTKTSPCWNGLIVPGSTLRYGSNFCSWTRRPRDFSRRPSDAATIPFPSADTTPPVTNTYFGARALTGFQGSSVGGRRSVDGRLRLLAVGAPVPVLQRLLDERHDAEPELHHLAGHAGDPLRAVQHREVVDAAERLGGGPDELRRLLGQRLRDHGLVVFLGRRGAFLVPLVLGAELRGRPRRLGLAGRLDRGRL